MQKKLLALAVAGVLAAPAVAMAQSAVTISGFFKVGIDNYSIGNANTALRSAGGSNFNTSEYRITDNASRMIFGITEDIGGGMAGIAQVDMRFSPDLGALTANGNTWVGLRSTSLGTATMGRHDLHYGKQPDDIAAKAGALQASATSLMDYTFRATAIAHASRTPNVLRYDSPNWGGFAFTAAYSASPGVSTSAVSGNATSEGDLATAIRKGNAYNFNPAYTASNFGVGYSYWKQKADGGGTAADQTGNVFYGYYTVAGFKVGLALNSSKTENVSATGTNTSNADRRVWTVPVSWTSGSHNIYAHYTRAAKDKVGTVAGGTGTTDGTDAKMFALAYVYDLSKRTSVGLTYAKIDNGNNAAYNFHNISAGGTNNLVNAGEDPRLLALTVRHAF
jgi:predicted porin